MKRSHACEIPVLPALNMAAVIVNTAFRSVDGTILSHVGFAVVARVRVTFERDKLKIMNKLASFCKKRLHIRVITRQSFA